MWISLMSSCSALLFQFSFQDEDMQCIIGKWSISKIGLESLSFFALNSVKFAQTQNMFQILEKISQFSKVTHYMQSSQLHQ